MSVVENARNLTTKDNLPLTIGHYLRNMALLTDQYFERLENYKEKNRQRIYLKDIDCPPVWEDKLKEYIPNTYFYLNESTGEIGGPGAVNEHTPNITGSRKGRGIAPAGDLMSSLPKDMRAENLMCYIGHEGTYTPAHREMCATLGHNIMVEASGTINDEGEHERPGSSIWFMTETKDRHLVAEYWLSILGHDIEVESHFAQIVALKKAPFKVYVIEQKPGDLILIPPLAPHQVWNRGTRTMKVAWNRTTVETLEMAFSEALPNARMVCRDEQYKCKAIVYFTLLKYSSLVKLVLEGRQQPGEAALLYRYDRKMRQLQKDFKRLLILYKSVLLSETFNPDITQERPEFIPFDSNVTCSYCRGNIFNRFLTCPSCKDAFATGVDEPYDVCMECYVMGRSCGCISGLKWVEQWKWKDLCRSYEEWRKLYILLDGGLVDGSLYTLQEERRFQLKKPLAQICQEQLRSRPWRDYKNPKANAAEDEENEEEEVLVNEDGTIKKTTKKHSKKYLRTHHPCHVCLHRHPDWKMANCTKCARYWCYGSLFRAHDLMPQTIMEDPRWVCPHCQMRCSTGACRRDPRQHPHEPKGTLLGHDTRKVADVRSVESLVDFSVSNLNWLKETKEAPTQSVRLDQRKEEAERAKQVEPSLDGNYVDDDEDEVAIPGSQGQQTASNGDYSRIEFSPGTPVGGAIDPALLGPPEAARPSTDRAVSNTILRDAMDANGDDIARMESYAGETPYLYPEPSYGEHSDSQLPRKRPLEDNVTADEQIKRVTKKKRKVAEDGANGADDDRNAPPAQSDALKEFRKHQERKMLEEARKADRYNQAYAALKGRRKVVRLKVSSHQLAQLRAQNVQPNPRPGQNRTVGQQNGAARRDGGVGDVADAGAGVNAGNDTILIRSDVAVAPLAPADVFPDSLSRNTNVAASALTSANPNQKQSKTQFRYRVEDDDDFGARRDRRRRRPQSTTNALGGGGPNGSFTSVNNKPRKAKRARYEEITISGSESDGNDDEHNDGNIGQNAVSGNERRRRALLAKRQRDGDENLPAELPDDWKDGRASRAKGRNRPNARNSDGGAVVGLEAAAAGETRMSGATAKKVRFSTGGSGVAARIRPAGMRKTKQPAAQRKNVAYVEVESDEEEEEDVDDNNDIDDNDRYEDISGNDGIYGGSSTSGAVVRDAALPQLDGPSAPLPVHSGFADVAINRQTAPNTTNPDASSSFSSLQHTRPKFTREAPRAKQQARPQGVLATALGSSTGAANGKGSSRTTTAMLSTNNHNDNNNNTSTQRSSHHHRDPRRHHQHHRNGSTAKPPASRPDVSSSSTITATANTTTDTTANTTAAKSAEENLRAKMMAAAEWGDLIDGTFDDEVDDDNYNGITTTATTKNNKNSYKEKSNLGSDLDSDSDSDSDSDPDGGVIPARSGARSGARPGAGSGAKATVVVRA